MRSLARLALLALAAALCVASSLASSASSSSVVPAVVVGSLHHSDVQRTVDLRTHIEEVTVRIKAKNTGTSPVSTYLVALPGAKADRLAFLEGVQGRTKLLSRAVSVSSASAPAAANASFWELALDRAVAPGASVELTLTQVFTRTQRPYPESIEQADAQMVLYDDSSVLYSPYASDSVETLLRLASSRVESYTKKGAKKSGDEIRYGPFSGVGAFETRELSVHFVNNYPFATFNSVSRDIEVSHWGNVAVQDNYVLTHTGAKLKGPFVRHDYERSRFTGENQAPASFRTLVAELPRTARDVYYRDCIGNVSTSHLRRARDHTRLEVDPRFPMFGGWESDFYIGYNLPSQHYLSVSRDESDLYVLNISFASPFASVAVDDLVVRVILPEGASDIAWRTPFDIDAARMTEFKTYLDTTGRPTLVLHKRNCVRHHAQQMQVVYRFAKTSILREPLLISAAVMLLLLLVIAFTHADLRIVDDDAASSLRAAHASPLSTRRKGTALGESIQQVLEALLASPNGLLAAAAERVHAEKQNLVHSLTREISDALRAIEKEESSAASLVSTLTGQLVALQKASKRFVSAAAGAELRQARQELEQLIDQVRTQAQRLADL